MEKSLELVIINLIAINCDYYPLAWKNSNGAAKYDRKHKLKAGDGESIELAASFSCVH